MVNVAIVVILATLSTAKPIIVTFGTNQGPIVPPPKPSNESRPVSTRNPAPVFEELDDIPNPNTYRPLVPHQYRTKLLSYRPPSNLIFGTPIDQKYTPALDKFDVYRKEGRSSGVDYRGPHVFERQPYEIAEALKRKSTKLQPSVRYVKQHYYDGKAAKFQQQQQEKQDDNGRYVPQIGIVYVSGVRYYVPQINYYQEDQENSVYDQDDQKYVYHKQ